MKGATALTGADTNLLQKIVSWNTGPPKPERLCAKCYLDKRPGNRLLLSTPILLLTLFSLGARLNPVLRCAAVKSSQRIGRFVLWVASVRMKLMIEGSTRRGLIYSDSQE